MWTRKIELSLLCAAGLCSIVGEAAAASKEKTSSKRAFDTSVFAQGDVSSADMKKNLKKEFRKSEAAPTGMLNLDESEIVETLRGISLLVSKTRDDRELPVLLLNRAMASFSLARKRLNDSQALKMDEKGVRLLKVGLADCQKVLKSSRLSKEMIARAHYIRGLIFIYQDEGDSAANEFKKSLEVYPNSENSGWMGLHIAEDFFEKGQFKNALQYYKKFLKKLTPEAYDLARYKIAWCYVNLNDFEEARRTFLAIILSASKEGYAKDSLRDLAFVLSARSSEVEILDVADHQLKKDEDRVEFLAAVMNQLETQNVVKLQSKVLSRLLELESDPVKKLQYLLAGMRTSRREYASVDHYNSFVKIREFMKKEDLSSKEIKSVKISLEQEAQFLIKSFLETFSGKVKTPERLPKAKVGQGLKNLFAFYEKVFEQSKMLPEIITLWENVCYEIEDWKCVDEVAEKILNNPKKKADHRRVAIDQLLALEQLNKEKKDSLESRVEEKFTKFLADYPRAEQWQNVANRLVSIYSQTKATDKALDLLDQIFEHERTGQTLFELMRVRFEQKKYSEILADSRSPSRKEDPRVDDIKREAALRLAIEARTNSDEKAYRKYLTQFLRLNPPAAKLAIVRKDLLEFLLEKKDYLAAQKELVQIPENQRCASALKNECLATWRGLMLSGKFSEAHSVFGVPPKKAPFPFVLQVVLADLSIHGKDSSNAFDALDAAAQEYVLGLLSLFEPELAVNVLKRKSLKVSAAHSIPFKLIALRLKNNQWDLQKDRESIFLLGPRYSFASVGGEGTPIKSDKLLGAILVPKGKVSEKKLGTVSAQIGQAVLQMRRRLQKDLAAKIPLEDKIRILEKAVKVEASVATFIKLQDTPRSIPEEQVAQYQEKVTELAQGYELQSQEWQKVLDEIRGAREKLEAEKASQSLVLSSAAEYPWGSSLDGPERMVLNQLLSDSKELAAMIVLDLARSGEKSNQEDYFRLRTGIVFSGNSSAVMRRYLFQELKQASQNELLNELQNSTKKVSAGPKAHSNRRQKKADTSSVSDEGTDLSGGELQDEQ